MTTIDEWPRGRARFFSALFDAALACKAVTHFNNRRRVMNNRTRVLIMASIISQACCASKVNATRLLPSAHSTSSPVVRKWVRSEMPRRRDVNPPVIARITGKANAISTRPIRTACGAFGMAQLATSAKKAAGAERERRKLSSIFQRPTKGIPLP